MRTLLGLAAAGLVLVVAAAAQAPKDPRSTYSDAVYGFAFDAPRFPPAGADQVAIPVNVSGVGEGGFASNVNVMVQPKAASRKAYRDRAIAQFKQMGLTLHAARDLTVSDRDAALFDYSGRIAGRDLHFLALAVIAKDRVFLVTCTATAGAFKRLEPEFRACLDSFRLQ